jgi:hypothetical protein
MEEFQVTGEIKYTYDENKRMKESNTVYQLPVGHFRKAYAKAREQKDKAEQNRIIKQYVKLAEMYEIAHDTNLITSK